ncbi:MAG: hypothetical protein HPY57_15260 [Ignavibacteria bacterium]|nr:hypothetical protein [Ignavibacteria bacterium]
MNIDYVVISSDDNPLYKDFYPIVSAQWNKLGYKVFYLNITNNETDINETKYGLIKNIKVIDGIDSGFQSQNVRLFATSLLRDKNLLMSDIDMLPLNGNYFRDKAKNLPDNKLLFYSGQPYSNVPFYPICYILGKGQTFVNLLEIEKDYVSFIMKMRSYSNMDWNTDEKYIYNTINKFNRIGKCEILRDRDFKNRIDRSNWTYDINKLKESYYIDSHLLRPYNKYKKEIDILCI